MPIDKLHNQLGRTECSAALPAVGNEKLPPAEIYRRLKQGVVIIGLIREVPKTDDYSALCAAGFVLSSSGIVVTNYHVVHDHDSVAIVVRTFDGQMLGVKEVLAADAEHDVAILQTTGRDLTPIAFGPGHAGGQPGHGDQPSKP